MKARFICIWKTKKSVLMNQFGISGFVEEKLFIPSGQYKKFAAAKNKADRMLFDFW